MVFTKYSGNPVLGPQAFPGDIMYVFNPGAIRYNGEYLLIVDAATADRFLDRPQQGRDSFHA